MNESILFISSSPVHFEAANKKIIQEEMPFHLSFGEYSASEKREKKCTSGNKEITKKKYIKENKKRLLGSEEDGIVLNRTLIVLHNNSLQ